MKLTQALLLNAKPEDEPYKLRDRDWMYLLVSVARSKTWKLDYGWTARNEHTRLGDSWSVDK